MGKENVHREIADLYQGFFNFMSDEHGLILTISEMNEIVMEAEKLKSKIEKVAYEKH